MGGLDVVPYHVTNLALHLLVGLTLLAVLRRSLRASVVPEAVRRHADGVALASALVRLRFERSLVPRAAS